MILNSCTRREKLCNLLITTNLAVNVNKKESEESNVFNLCCNKSSHFPSVAFLPVFVHAGQR